MQHTWKDYLTFNKKERRAVFILLAIMLIVGFLPALFPAKKLEIIELASNDSLSTQQIAADIEENEVSAAENSLQPFSFDPNIVSEAELQRMNMRPKLIHTIINYRSKGGKFFQPADIRKLFTITKEEADELIPYVMIRSVQQPNNYYLHDRTYQSTTEKIIPIDHVIDINSASLEEVKRLPGISASLANKIVNYREMIGGFKNADQLKKVYGMNDSIYSSIKSWINSLPEKNLININKASLKEMTAKNLIPETVARAIIIYREQHKGFKTVSELMNIPFISKEIFDKIAPSLTTE